MSSGFSSPIWLSIANSGKYTTLKEMSRTAVAPMPLYSPKIPLSAINLLVSCVAVMRGIILPSTKIKWEYFIQLPTGSVYICIYLPCIVIFCLSV